MVEDFARFVLDDSHLTSLAKTLRHDLSQAASAVAMADRQAVRETSTDVGTAITVPSEQQRGDALQVCQASLERTKQSLRSIEEYGKLACRKFASQVEAIRYRVYTLEKSLGSTLRGKELLCEARLCVLISGCDNSDAFGELVQSLVDADAGMLQLRDKQLPDAQLLDRARQLVALTRDAPTIAIINDRPDIAAAVHAGGVHLGQDDLPVKAARMIVGPQALIGVSTHDIDQARQAVLDGANYLGAGPTFPSSTKSFDKFPGLAYLQEVSAEISLPTYAIGGIDARNVDEVCQAGAMRIAVSSAVASAADPAAAAQKLLARLTS